MDGLISTTRKVEHEHRHQRPQQGGRAGFAQHRDGDMSVEQAQAILDGGQTYFDYLEGRVMKVDLSGDSFETYLYDRDNGEGAAFTVIRALRESGNSSNEDIKRLHRHGTSSAAEEVMTWGDDDVIAPHSVLADAQSNATDYVDS